MSDIARWPAGRIRSKDPPNDRRFLLDNLQLPGVADNSAIAVSTATSMATIADYACHSAADFFCAILSLHLAHETANTDQDRVGGAVVHCLDFDSLERK